jgi:hypothetical protein
MGWIKHRVEVLGVKMTIKHSKRLPPKGFKEINLYPFKVYTRGCAKNGLSDKTLRHEAIHTMQTRSLLILPYYIWYGLEYLIKLAICWNRDKAYKSICFEQEAYYNSNNLNYGEERQWINFLVYIFKMYNYLK